mmetsp:Transcript_75449/g.153109  ORF Transcript_75449/g.153109 Transcript_75449/m.153109 type:complete len:85 (+) Transcript_75449:1732-1986(+)
MDPREIKHRKTGCDARTTRVFRLEMVQRMQTTESATANPQKIMDITQISWETSSKTGVPTLEARGVLVVPSLKTKGCMGTHVPC